MASFSLEMEPIIFSWAHSFLERKLHFPVSIAQLDKVLEIQTGQWGMEESLMK